MNKKFISLIMCMVFVLLMASSCTISDKKTEPSLTVMYKTTENGGNDELIMNKISENLGMNVEYVKAPSASYTEKLNSVLVSGNLPEIVYLDIANMNRLIEEGAILPLDDYLVDYAPNFSEIFEDEDKKNIVNAYDGKIYGLPYILKLPVQHTMGVRRDWMEKLSLDDPENIEELEAVLTAFRDNAHILNPGGEVIPYAGSLGIIYDIYGIDLSGDEGKWTLDKEGNYISIYEHPNFIKCIETINRFYEKGLIDKEYLTRSENITEVYELFNDGVVGMGCVYSTRLREISEILMEKDENAMFDYMKPPKGYNGVRRIIGRNMYGGVRACLTIAAKGKEKECMKYIDYFYSEEGDKLLNYGIEGIHYDLVDGKPKIKDEFNHGWVKIRKEGIVPTNVAYNRNLDAYNQCLFYGKEASELSEVEMLTYKAYHENEPYVVEPLPTFKSEKDASEIYNMLSENSSKAIAGIITTDELSEVILKAKEMGLDEITNQMQMLWEKVK